MVARRRAGLAVFWLGVFLLFVHTTLPALWELFGPRTPYPLSSLSRLGAIATGFTPPLGAALMVVAGVLAGPHTTREGA